MVASMRLLQDMKDFRDKSCCAVAFKRNNGCSDDDTCTASYFACPFFSDLHAQTVAIRKYRFPLGYWLNGEPLLHPI